MSHTIYKWKLKFSRGPDLDHKSPSFSDKGTLQHPSNMPRRTRLSRKKNWERKRQAKKAQVGILCLFGSNCFIYSCAIMYAAVVCQRLSMVARQLQYTSGTFPLVLRCSYLIVALLLSLIFTYGISTGYDVCNTVYSRI